MSCVAISTELDMAVSGSEVCPCALGRLLAESLFLSLQLSAQHPDLPSAGWNCDHTHCTPRSVCCSIKASGGHTAWTYFTSGTGV